MITTPTIESRNDADGLSDLACDVILESEISSDPELLAHDRNPTMFAASSWLDLAQTYERLEANTYKGTHQKELDLEYKDWFKALSKRFVDRAADQDEQAADGVAYLRTVAARASAFVEFVELLTAKKKHVRQKLQEIDQGPTNVAIRQIQYGIWWRGLRHAARVMGFGGIVGGVPGAAISYWQPYAEMLAELLHIQTSPTLLAAVSSVIFTTIVSMWAGIWMYRSGQKARANRKRRYRQERRALLRDYGNAYAEGCTEVDHALARLVKLPAERIATFDKRWPNIEKRLAAEIDSCYFDEEDEQCDG